MPRFRLDPFATAGISPVVEKEVQPQRQQIAPRPIPIPEYVKLVEQDPSYGQPGELIYNTVDSLLKIWVGGAWVTITGGGGTPSSVYGTAIYGTSTYA